MSGSRSGIAIAIALALSFALPAATADTARVGDSRDPVGQHDIRRLVLDNTGNTVGATVWHRGSRWLGKVRLAFDTAGDSGPEYIAVIDHAQPPRALFTRAGGRPWRCAARTARSRPDGRRTKLTAPRQCLGGARSMSVRVTASSPKRPSDSAFSRQVLQQTRPNVVMIIVDDMRADDLRYMPLTRRLIGDRGVTFRNSLSPHPLCCPARASILTGQYTHNHRVWSHKKPFGFPAFHDKSTLATWLQNAGYATTLLGKYLNGYGRLPEPGARSGRSLHYVPPGWTDWRASIDGGLPAGHPKDGGTYRYFDTTLSRNGRGFDNYRRYQTQVYGRLSSQIIESRAASDRPFFLYASYSAPHHGMPREADDPVAVDAFGNARRMATPAVPASARGKFNNVITEAPGADWSDPDLGADKPAYLRHDLLTRSEKSALVEVTRQRAEALSVVDREVKRTMDALEATGESDETMVIFTSDNGYFLGEQGIRQGKILPHDPSLRTPLLIRGPGIPAGRVRYDPFLSIDFAPTIADFANVTPRLPVDGVSMLPVARDGDRGWTRPVLTETGPRGIVRDTDESGDPLPASAGQRDFRYVLGIRTDRFLYTDIATKEEELYDMETDPNQYTNLVTAPEYATILGLLRVQLRRVRSCAASECRVNLPPALDSAPGQSIRNPARR